MYSYSTASYVLRVLNYTLEVMVARGKGKVIPETGSLQNGWTKFVNIPVVGLEWAEVQAKYGSGRLFVDTVAAMCEQGYRFGVSYNHQSDAFICSVTCKNVDSPNNGCTFTSFAGTWHEAMMLALYKHYDVAGEKWLEKGGAAQLPAFG
jgi:hypothetical protein